MKNSITSSMRSLAILVFLYTVASFSGGCSKDDKEEDTFVNTAGNPDEVIMQGTSFSPSSITVQAGTRVTWRNRDGMTHTVTSDSGLFDSGNIPDKGSYSFTFSTPGSYPYHCSLHAGMTGIVIVN